MPIRRSALRQERKLGAFTGRLIPTGTLDAALGESHPTLLPVAALCAALWTIKRKHCASRLAKHRARVTFAQQKQKMPGAALLRARVPPLAAQQAVRRR